MIKTKLLHQFFETCSRRSPEKIAWVIGNRRMTYGAANMRANQLAHYLAGLEVRPETTIGLWAGRSCEAMVAILAILKAGCVYVPFDPTYPKARLDFMVQDVGTSIILTQKEFLTGLPATVDRLGIKVVCLDRDCSAICRHPPQNPMVDVQPSNLAFIVYTSGSTGDPKGVMTTHGNMCSYLAGLQEAVGIQEQDHYLHTASFAFSSSNRQLMLPFSQGATVVMATAAERTAPLALFRRIRNEGVTVIDLVPTHWRDCIKALAALGEKEKWALLRCQLRLVLSASAPLMFDTVHDWRHQLRQSSLIFNMYGATETTGIMAIFEMPPVTDDRPGTVPIGRPLGPMEIFILDETMKKVPKGATGSLYVAGPHLARGYLHQGGLTGDRFLANPYDPNSRLYRTGDLGRVDDQGNLVCMGRADFQLEVKGHRIEPGEIEVHLKKHPLVQDVVVDAKPLHGDNCLVAYFVRVQNQKKTPEPTQFRAFLRTNLPEFMVPAFFVSIKKLPVTVNGKVDRFSLPQVNLEELQLDQTVVTPRSPLEKTLATLWQRNLGIHRIGLFNDYFTLGGNSLKGSEMLSHVHRRLGVDLPLPLLFEKPTIAALAEHIETILEKTETVQEFERGRI